MDYVKFGNTGMDVSRICLGAMGFGDPNSGFHNWVLEGRRREQKSHKKCVGFGDQFL